MQVFLQNPTIQLFFVGAMVCILLDFVTGVAKAVRNHTFKTTEIANFVGNNVVPYVSLLVAQLFLPLLNGVAYQTAAVGATSAVVVFCLAQIASASQNIAAIVGFPAATFEGMILGALATVFPALAHKK